MNFFSSKNRLVCLGLTVLLVVAPGCAWQSELDRAESELQTARERLEQLEKRLRKTSKALKKSQTRIKEYESTIGNLENTVLDLERLAKQLRDERRYLREREDSLDQQLKATQRSLSSMALRRDDLKRQKQNALENLDELRDQLGKLEEQRRQQLEDLRDRIGQLELAQSERLDALEERNRELRERLSNITDANARIEGQNVVVTLDARILFDLGRAELKTASRRTLDSLAQVFTEYEERVIGVEGHTDTVPVTSDRYESNWDLSAARAVTVVEYLIDEQGIAPERLGATGYGEHRPIYPNRTPEDRSLNRRVEIVLYPALMKQKALSEL